MRALRVIGIVLGVLFLLVVGAALLLPSEYDIERKIVIKSTPECPFDHVNDLEKNVVWSPWKATDPSMKIEVGDKSVGEGASYSWMSEKAGEGSYTIIESVPHRTIKSTVDLGVRGSAQGSWEFVRQGQETEVTWHFHGESGGLLGRYEALLMGSVLGSDFGHGLERMKQICEA